MCLLQECPNVTPFLQNRSFRLAEMAEIALSRALLLVSKSEEVLEQFHVCSNEHMSISHWMKRVLNRLLVSGSSCTLLKARSPGLNR